MAEQIDRENYVTDTRVTGKKKNQTYLSRKRQRHDGMCSGIESRGVIGKGDSLGGIDAHNTLSRGIAKTESGSVHGDVITAGCLGREKRMIGGGKAPRNARRKEIK